MKYKLISHVDVDTRHITNDDGKQVLYSVELRPNITPFATKEDAAAFQMSFFLLETGKMVVFDGNRKDLLDIIGSNETERYKIIRYVESDRTDPELAQSLPPLANGPSFEIDPQQPVESTLRDLVYLLPKEILSNNHGDWCEYSAYSVEEVED